MSTSKPSAARLTRAGIGETYGESERTVDAWVRLLNFPTPVADGEWDAEQVDAWVKVSRPQSWPGRAVASAVAPAAAQAEPAGAAVAEDASVGDELLGKSGLALRYKVAETTVDTWTKVEGFPAEAEPGRWRSPEVDTWIEEHRSHVWAEFKGEGPKVVIPPPEGNPKDLYDISGYGMILGNATRGEPLPRATAQNYKRQGHLEPPDRTPGDRKRPEVFEDMWYLETITRHVYSRRGQGRVRAGRTRRPNRKKRS
ncbi:hypothetical protein ABT093_39090 [Kitasatospora sp. NPDC002551]|uniref:hypothetical protein n=1 Tax=Kitasatospora sp. NPDC002551 TaxID=3154539 RepID=UPI003330307C